MRKILFRGIGFAQIRVYRDYVEVVRNIYDK